MIGPAIHTLAALVSGTEKRWQWYGQDETLGECWCGTDGYACRFGYRRIDLRIRGLNGRQKRLSAHILAWLLDHLGPMQRDELYLAYAEFRASGLQLDHQCDEPACRRPSHLNPCTQAENIAAGKERQYQRDLARALANPTPVEYYEDEEALPF